MAETPAEDLDALVRRVDSDRWLSSRFIADQEKRADVVALYAFDYELRRAVEATTNPIMAEIRLTWWGEALDEIYAGGVMRRHPVVDALSGAITRRRLPRPLLEAVIETRLDGGEAGAQLAEAAALILDPGVDRQAVRESVDDRPDAARRVSAAAFPAVAHAALRRAPVSDLRKRLRLTWAVLRGRL